MAKQHEKTRTSVSAGGGTATARAVEPIVASAGATDPEVEPAAPLSAPKREQIARLAYSYWQARGCPEGSPEEDWLRAEAELRN